MKRKILFVINQISGVKTTLDFGKFVLKHEAFRSGKFDTNFVKEHFSSPELMKDAMEEESVALQHAIDSIWDHVNEFKNKAYASREISSSWKNRME